MDGLTLQCICSPDASMCQITALTWEVEIARGQFGPTPIGAVWYLTLLGSTGSFVELIDYGTGTYSFLLPLSRAIADWSSLFVKIFMDASLFQVPSPPGSSYELFMASHRIRQDYHCVNLITGIETTQTLYAQANAGPPEKCLTAADDLRGIVSGGIGGIFFKSTPLGACLSGGITTGDCCFEPPPTENTFDIDNSGQICLCATGGSGDYLFSIVAGSLASGQSLNKDTGCIEGYPDGRVAATPAITFRVTDLGGGDVTETTGGDLIGGTCRVFGPGVTRISGGSFTSDMVGQPITVNGGNYTVDTVSGPDNLTITPADGIADPTTWSYKSPVIASPEPAAPASADVTCGFMSGCPTGASSAGASKNFAF